ncbi:hypothetical protein UA08_07765 [Talaromyces atroroseus]|uniref:BTB domain-containing protein n=1 Tax=Talaromyces atroroseus TaxID=1441469 RepID=A0A225AD57_TALAT|nr:hypothetical protein UA08_07765 [Talaromyces atroroseus]OKL56873.1 hypothetical protein UA08_07765 [Talaromyces atroroseus]
MNRLPDFTRLISSPPFTFLVGKDHTKLTIQSALAQHVSRPLDDLMNNGHTRESKHRIAVLEDEEVEVFTAFTQYAYTGNYTVPEQKSELQLPTRPAAELSPVSSSKSTGSRSASGAVEQQQQQQQLQPLSIVRAQSSASFLPPPAPTPPPFDRLDAKHGQSRRYAETPLAVAADQWDNPFAHPAEQQQNEHSFREDTPPAEVVNVGSQNDPPAQEDQDAGADAEAAEEEWVPKKAGKKDKKKKRKNAGAATAVFEEAVPTTSLTPPSTPPIDVRDEVPPKRKETKVVVIQQARPDYDADCAVETDPGDDGEADAYQEREREEDGDGDWWDQPVFPPSGRRRGRERTPPRRVQPLIDTSFASQRISAAPRKRGANTWTEFAALDYFHQPQQPVDYDDNDHKQAAAQPLLIVVPYILFHAKVYVFATRYLISGLAQLCLQKLHTSLVDYPLSHGHEHEHEDENENEDEGTESLRFNAHAKMFLDILRYTYENTTRFEPESQTSATQLRECELRKLVAQYAACKMRELAAYTPAAIPVLSSPSHGPGSGVSMIPAPGGGLRELLDRIPELASDLVFMMM